MAGSRVRVTTRGGKRFNEVLKNARRKGAQIELGIHPDAAPYDDGTEVALVAIAHEYGLGEHTEKAWFRSAIIEISDQLKKKKIRTLARGGGLGDRDPEQIAELAVERIKASIRNAGLVDTGRLINSIKAQIKRW